MPPNYSSWSRLLLFVSLRKPQFSRKISSFPHFPPLQTSPFFHTLKATHFSTASAVPSGRIVQDLLAELDREKQREREARNRAGKDTKDIDLEDEEDYLGVGPLIDKLEKEKLKSISPELLNQHEEPTDSDSDEDDERWSSDALKRKAEQFEKKFNRHKELLKNFTDAETLDDAYKWTNRINKFEEKHFQIRPEYRVIGELMNRLKVAQGKEKFLLQQKLNRAMRLMKWKEASEPNYPENYGVIWQAQSTPDADLLEGAGLEKQKQIVQGGGPDDVEEEEFDDMKKRDEMLLEKLDAIDKKLEEKLAELDHMFERKGKALEEEIRDLAEERNELTEKKRRPMYRKGFDVKLIGINKTTKVTKGGRNFRYSALIACGLSSYTDVASCESEKHISQHSGNLGMKFGFPTSGARLHPPYALGFRSFIHTAHRESFNKQTDSKPMDFVREVVEEGGSQYTDNAADQNADVVYINLMRNNTFVTVTDSKGNRKYSGSSGHVPELRGGPKMSRYTAEATAEHVGREARKLGLKSIVVKVKGFTYFKKKRQAIMSFREGFTDSRSDWSPIVAIEDTTRRPHNGCRLPKKRRI